MLSHRIITIAVLAFAACNGSPSTRSFKLVPANNGSAAPVNVTITVPDDWRVTDDAPGEPVFKIPDLARGSHVALTVIELTGSPAAMMQKAIDAQDLSGGQRVELSGGRVWLQKHTGMLLTSQMTEGRVFVPYANGVVMGVAFLHELDKLPDIRKAFETLAIAP